MERSAVNMKFKPLTECNGSRYVTPVSVWTEVLPVIAYKAEIDLSDEGSIKMLDAYARFVPNDTWNVTLGQMRVLSP